MGGERGVVQGGRQGWGYSLLAVAACDAQQQAQGRYSIVQNSDAMVNKYNGNSNDAYNTITMVIHPPTHTHPPPHLLLDQCLGVPTDGHPKVPLQLLADGLVRGHLGVCVRAWKGRAIETRPGGQGLGA